ncbi:MAG: DUF5131 family protein [Nitrososphaerota archaeon]|nr:DUF5131 family protein [Nitrososphaerota archaeon]
MAKFTNIGWTKSTLNLAWGCTRVTTECSNCYMGSFQSSPRERSGLQSQLS